MNIAATWQKNLAADLSYFFIRDKIGKARSCYCSPPVFSADTYIYVLRIIASFLGTADIM